MNTLTEASNPEHFSLSGATYDSYSPSNPYNNSVFRYGDDMLDYWDTTGDHYNNLW